MYVQPTKSINLMSISHTFKHSPEFNIACIIPSEIFYSYMSGTAPGREPKKTLHKAIIANKKSTFIGFFISISIKKITVKVPKNKLRVFFVQDKEFPFRCRFKLFSKFLVILFRSNLFESKPYSL